MALWCRNEKDGLGDTEIRASMIIGCMVSTMIEAMNSRILAAVEFDYLKQSANISKFQKLPNTVTDWYWVKFKSLQWFGDFLRMLDERWLKTSSNQKTRKATYIIERRYKDNKHNSEKQKPREMFDPPPTPSRAYAVKTSISFICLGFIGFSQGSLSEFHLIFVVTQMFLCSKSWFNSIFRWDLYVYTIYNARNGKMLSVKEL